LIYYEELSYEEVALIMDLKIKTIYNLIHLAISKLRERKASCPLRCLAFSSKIVLWPSLAMREDHKESLYD